MWCHIPRDAVTLSQGLPIDDATIKRMEDQRQAAPQAVGEATQPVSAPVPPASTEVPPLAPQSTVATGSSIAPLTSSMTAALILSVTLPPTLSGLIQDIHGDFGCILRYLDYLGKKVESIDQRLVHIEGIVDPSHAPAPRVVLDILVSDKDEDSDADP